MEFRWKGAEFCPTWPGSRALGGGGGVGEEAVGVGEEADQGGRVKGGAEVGPVAGGD